MELVGRRAERAVLEAAFRRARDGRRTIVSIRGEAGIGKSALLGDAHQLARTHGATFLSSSVTEAESGIGWGGLATLLHGMSAELIGAQAPVHAEALRSVMGAGDATALDPLNAAAALAEVLRHVVAAGPAVVAMDDVHWLDAASAGALSFALRLLADVPLMFVLASRPVRSPIDLGRVVDAASLLLIEPAPLSLAGTRQLLIERFGIQLGRVDLVRIHTNTGGNPLHVIETGRLLRAGIPLVAALLPPSLRDIIEIDLRRIGADDLPILAGAALMPQARVSLLKSLFEPARVDAAIAAADDIDLVRVHGDTVVFRHPLLVAGLAERLSSSERRALHRRCVDLATNDEIRAFHLSEAAFGIDSVAAELLDAAASAATERGLYPNALAHAERALALTDPADADAVRRRTVSVADVAIASGEPQRAIDLLGPFAAGAKESDPQWADITESLAVALAAVVGPSEALPMLERVAATRPVGSVERANAVGQVAAAMMYVDIGRASQWCADAEAAATEVGDRHLVQVAGAARLLADILAGKSAQRMRIDASQAVSLRVLCDWFTAAVWTDDLVRAEELFDACLTRLAERPTVVQEHNILNQATDLRLRQGRLAEAATIAERALIISDAIDQGGPRSCDMAVVSAVRGDLAEARRHATFALSVSGSFPALIAAQSHFASGFVEALAGNTGIAAGQLRLAAQLWDSVGALDLGVLPIRTELAEVLVQLGELHEAEALIERMAELAAAAARPRSSADVQFVGAQLLAAQGRLDEAALAIESATATYEELELRVHTARALQVAGHIARRTRRRSAARELLERSLALLTSCGADGYVPRVEAELSRLGERAAPDQLTATESRIATLVAAGLSNDEVAAQLFVSRRTVESNLTRIYRKINVRGRAELAARFASRPS